MLNYNPNKQVFQLIDGEDVPLLYEHKWSIVKLGNHKYLRTTSKVNGRSRLLHELLMNTPTKMSVDHINHNTLDNRRSNLRICTHLENLHNAKRHKDNKSGYKGIWLDKNGKKKKWVARIRVNGKNIALGYYFSARSAAKAYNEAALKYFGNFACINKL